MCLTKCLFSRKKSVCVCVYGGEGEGELMCVHMFAHARWSEDDLGYFQKTLQLWFETGSFIDLELYHISYASWPASARNLPVSASHVTIAGPLPLASYVGLGMKQVLVLSRQALDWLSHLLRSLPSIFLSIPGPCPDLA